MQWQLVMLGAMVFGVWHAWGSALDLFIAWYSGVPSEISLVTRLLVCLHILGGVAIAIGAGAAL